MREEGEREREKGSRWICNVYDRSRRRGTLTLTMKVRAYIKYNGPIKCYEYTHNKKLNVEIDLTTSTHNYTSVSKTSRPNQPKKKPRSRSRDVDDEII